jgi:DNA-binding HxlR family transcriptional regulator
MAAEIVCTRWTALVLRDLLAGSTRFTELQRGLPRMSSALLSKRLKELERSGLVRRLPNRSPGSTEYQLSKAGRDLAPVIQAMADWGLRWADPEISLQRLDVSVLMWSVKRTLDATPPPPGRCTVEFTYPDVRTRGRRYWLIVTPRDVDLCNTDPGFPTDVYVTGSLRSMTAVWLGLAELREEIDSNRLEISGSTDLARLVKRWLGQSPSARARKQLAA